MDDRLDAVQRDSIAGDIGLHEPKPRKFAEARQVALFDVPRVERIEIIDAGHLIAAPDERLAQV